MVCYLQLRTPPCCTDGPILSAAATDRFVSELRSASQLRSELRQLREELEQLGSPLVFCHNDVLLDNVLLATDGGGVRLIDFEYGGVNHQAFDIGNHFNEFAGEAFVRVVKGGGLRWREAEGRGVW